MNSFSNHLLHRRLFIRYFLEGIGIASLPQNIFAKEKKPEIDKLDIPFFHQRSNNDCYQACLKMILKYFFPELDPSWNELDTWTHHKPGFWTFEAQLLPVLIERGLEARLFSTTPYAELNKEKAAERYGAQNIARLDFAALAWAAAQLKPEIFEMTRLEFPAVEKFFRERWVVFLCVDQNVLRGANTDRYSGHGVILTGLSPDQATFHEPAREPHLLVPRERLIAAWNAKGTDNAVIIVKRRG